jgi:sulfoxide reductase heme-binding subunit YedZ
LWAILLLLVSLAVTPARAVLDWPRVVLLRRMIGVAAACYATAHLAIYCLDQNFNLFKVMTEILSRFYLTVGWFTLVGLLALAITSTDGWQKSLGRDWKRLHKIIYALGVMALFHYAVQLKLEISDAVFLAGLFTWLMLWRVMPRRWQARLWPLPELALAAGLIAAVLEAGWYGVRNGVNVVAVLSANLDVMFGPRPAVAVVIAGFAVLLVAAARKLAKRVGRGRGMVGAARRA